MSQTEHYLIVGGGVGGLCLTWHLLRAEKKVTLIDRGTNQSSVVAAGLINPLVFRRMTKSWRADELIPYASGLYREMEQETGASFFHPIPIRRFFSSEQEKNFWLEKQDLPEFSAYMEPLTSADLEFQEMGLLNDFGTGLVKNAYWVNTPVFLEAVRDSIAQKVTVRTEEFDMTFCDAENARYKGESFTGIIFATGFENGSNPWFQSLPVQTTKGEVLTVESSELPENYSINRKCFVLPTGNGRFRVGATYVWDTTTAVPTEEGKEEILQKLAVLSPAKPTVIGHHAGIRPTSPDRRPIIGRHPEYSNLYLFNGLGTKGYMIAPLLSKEFMSFVLGKSTLPAEVDLNRFLK